MYAICRKQCLECVKRDNFRFPLGKKLGKKNDERRDEPSDQLQHGCKNREGYGRLVSEAAQGWLPDELIDGSIMVEANFAPKNLSLVPI